MAACGGRRSEVGDFDCTMLGVAESLPGRNGRGVDVFSQGEVGETLHN